MTKYEKFKTGLLTLFVVGFLICLHNYSKNGRYVSNENSFTRNITDTRTGNVYRLISEEKIDIENFK